MPYVRLENGLNVHFERVGTGPDLAMVHGVIGHMGIWHFKIVPMLWNEYQVLTYDLRGHGHTDMTPTGYTPTELAADFVQLLDALQISQIDLVGHSYGADIALYFCYLFPERVRRAVLIEPLVPAVFRMTTRSDFEGKEWLANTLESLGVDIPEERRLDTDYMLRMGFETSNKWGPRKGMPRTRQHKEWIERLLTSTSVLKDMLEVGDLTLDQLRNIRTPIHLVYENGSVLWRRSHRTLRTYLPNVTSASLRTRNGDLSHFVPHEKPEAVVNEIRKALQQPVPAAV